MPNVDLSLIGALSAAVATLGGVVAYMGKWFVKQFDELKAEVVTCREDRENLWRDRDRLWERIADIDKKLTN